MRGILLVGILLQTLFVGAQEQNVRGVISNSASNTAVQYAAVQLMGTPFGTVANHKGEFEFTAVPVGEYELRVSSLGFRGQKKWIMVKAGETLNLTVELEESIMNLPEFAIESSSLTGGGFDMQKIPGSAHYISPKALNLFSYTDINRTLRAVPGINIQEEDGYGLRPNIGLRGTGVERSSKITLMEDGILMAPAPYAASAAYYFPTIGRMQGVEILKGSSQIKYGPYTTGGAINLISAQVPNQFGGKAMLLGGAFGSRNAHLQAGNAHKNVGYVFETFQYKANGFKQLDGGGNTGFDKKDYLAKVRVNTNPEARVAQSLTFKAAQTLEESNETYVGLTDADYAKSPYRRYAGSQKDLMTTEQKQLSVVHTIQPTKWINVSTTAYRNTFARNWYKLDKVRADSLSSSVGVANILDDPENLTAAYNVLSGTASTAGNALYVKANNRNYVSQGIQTVVGLHHATGEIEHNLDLSIRYHTDQVDRFQWVDQYQMDNQVMKLVSAGEPGTESNSIDDATAMAAYLQYKLEYKRLLVVPGIRFEDITLNRNDYGKNDVTRFGSNLAQRSNKVHVFIPGIGASYQLSEYFTSFIGVHKGFSPPGSNVGALPESSTNYEIGLRAKQEKVSGEAIFYLNNYSNLLGADLAAAGGGGTNSLYNGGEAVAKGVEFQFEYMAFATTNSKIRLPLGVVYTYTDAEFKSDFDSDFEGWGKVSANDKLPYVAAHQFAVTTSLEHEKFNLNFSGKYVSEMRTAAGQGATLATAITDDYFVVDLSANYLIDKRFTLFGNVTNLLDNSYIVARRPSGVRPGMPRSFNFGAKVRF